MARQESTKSWFLWLLLLAAPLLALGFYLWTDDATVADPLQALPTNNSPVSLADKPRSSPAQEAPAVPMTDAPTGKPKVMEAKPESAVTALDPEAARAAVQQVENTVYERATAMFEQEPVDVDWAGAYEQSLREMFAQHPGLQRVSVNSISCHSSMCRIEVFTPRDTDADFFTAMFYDGLATFRAGELKADAAITRRMEQGMTSVYVARKNHRLGFY